MSVMLQNRISRKKNKTRQGKASTVSASVGNKIQSFFFRRNENGKVYNRVRRVARIFRVTVRVLFAYFIFLLRSIDSLSFDFFVFVFYYVVPLFLLLCSFLDGLCTRLTVCRLRWLETHIWHAKRMHMELSWGFMLPAKSNRFVCGMKRGICAC